MHKGFDLVDLKMLEALATYGSRNVTEVSRKLYMPAETLRKRIKRLFSQTFLRFNINIYYPNLGLRKAVVFAEAVPGYENVLFDALKINDFWIFLSRCYGMFEGCVGIFAVPNESRSQFEYFIGELGRIGLARRTQIFWSTCFHSVHSKCKWFNRETKTWNFDWDDWIKEIRNEDASLLYTLVDPEAFPVKADEIDLLILKELEKDARISFKRLGEKLGISPQLVSYHYHNHLLRRGLFKNFEVGVFHFGKDSELSFFIFSFDKGEKLAKFASSLLDKPFVKALSKILGKNELYGYLYFPISEFRRFLDVLSKLVRCGFLRSYQYVIQDLTNSSRATIPFQCFKNGKWIYSHERYMKILRKFSRKRALLTKQQSLKIHTKITKIHMSDTNKTFNRTS
jgi:DNA-binding Lrp family transcriptional regulator